MKLSFQMLSGEEGSFYAQCNADDNVVDVAKIVKIWTTMEAEEKLSRNENFEIS